MAFLDLSDGTPIHYIDTGPRTRRGILLVHGEPFSTWFWERAIGALQGSNRVVAFDVRGRGQSGDRSGRHTVPEFARDVDEIVRVLGLDAFVGVGWSMGAAILWSYVEQFGEDRIARFINVDQRPYRLLGEVERERLEQIKGDRRAFHRGRIREYLGPSRAESADVIDHMVEECLKTSTEGHLSSVEDVYMRDFRAVRASMRTPSATFWATYGWIDQPAMREMERDASGAWVFFPGSGHLLPWTDSEIFAREVLKITGS